MKNIVIPIFGSGMHGSVNLDLVFVVDGSPIGGTWGKISHVADSKLIVTKINDINDILFVGTTQNSEEIKN